MRRCPSCHRIVAGSAPACPHCGADSTALTANRLYAGTYSLGGFAVAASTAVALVVVTFDLLVLLFSAERTVDTLLLVPVLLSPFAGVLVIIWLWRARKNVDALGGGGLGAGWAIGGWLIPLANMVLPAVVMWQVARSSLQRSWAPALVLVWWFTYLGTSWSINPDALSSGSAKIAAGLFTIAGASLIALVAAITASQTDRIARAEQSSRS